MPASQLADFEIEEVQKVDSGHPGRPPGDGPPLATLGVMRYRHTLVLNKRLCVLLRPLLSRVW